MSELTEVFITIKAVKAVVNAHIRHDCWRGDIRIWEKQNGVWKQTHRKRKRFRVYQEAYEWVNQHEIST